MNVDFKQLRKDLDLIRKYLPDDDNEVWEAFDRILIVVEEMEEWL